MRLHIRFFAAARDVAGTADADIDVDDGATVADVRRLLAGRFTGLERVLRQSRIALNQRFATDTDVATDGAEVAIIPPVAGG